jgi:hypothetical protein
MVWLIGIPFIVIGTLCTLYAHRFGKWWALYSFKNKINPFITYKYETIEEFEHKFFEVQPRKAFWLVWVWGMRIMGALLALAGAAAIIVTSLNI